MSASSSHEKRCKKLPGRSFAAAAVSAAFAGWPQLNRIMDDQFFRGYASCATPASFTPLLGV